jgi:glycosyltransferase involved in cell wall biosynthesis
MSIPDDDFIAVDRPPHADGFLRILHLGRTAHLPSYRSLEFLLDQVFPQLPPSILDRLRLLVAGVSDDRDPRSTRIRQLASKYATQVEFLGFVPDLRPLFAEADIQVVASTQASGLRTRVVESWARGLPVLCTTAAADGLVGIEPGVNLLLADTPNQFSQALTTILEFPHQVRNVALAGRTAYDRFYARDVVASSLAGYLATHLQIAKPSEPSRLRAE